MKTSSNGIELIKSFEGCDLKAIKYPDEKYYTIGYGHYGSDVKKGQTITKEDATKLLINDLLHYEKLVNKYATRYYFSQNEFDALVSFCYNIGNIDRLTAKGTRTKNEISDKMLLYNKCNGKVLNGLTNRRKKERDLFLAPSTNYYYPTYNGNSKKVDEVLFAIGVPSIFRGNYKKRKHIADSLNISNYKGTFKQNLLIISKAKEGTIPIK